MGLNTEASVGAMMPITQPDQVFRKTEKGEINEAFNAIRSTMKAPKMEETFDDTGKTDDIMYSGSPEERRKKIVDPVDTVSDDPTDMDFDEKPAKVEDTFSNTDRSEGLMDSDSPEDRRKKVLDPTDDTSDDPTDMDFDEDAFVDSVLREYGIFDEEEEHSEDEIIYMLEEVNEDLLFLEDAHIDKDIRPTIDTLNRKGYKTIASCSGHPSARRKNDTYKDGVMYDHLYSGARIVFEKNYDIGPAPEGWTKKIMENGDRVGIYVKPPKANYAKGLQEDQYKKWKAKYMDSVRKWADELPEEGKKKEKVVEEDAMEQLLNELRIDLM